MTRNAPCNTDDVIDSRSIIERIDELTEEQDAYNEGEDGKDATPAERVTPWSEAYPDEAEELRILTELAEEASGSPDWKYGETLIRESYFKEYAQELAEDIGAVPDDLKWPCTCIDWDQAAREMRMDYFAVDFDGVTYFIRS